MFHDALRGYRKMEALSDVNFKLNCQSHLKHLMLTQGSGVLTIPIDKICVRQRVAVKKALHQIAAEIA